MGDTTSASGGGWEPPSIEHLQTLLPQYEISRLLGHGGMGAVYEGVQSNLDRKVAIKILPETFGPEEEGLNFTDRFKLEAKSMANLDHPGIISIYDFGETDEGQFYFVMEFIDGMDIHQYLKHHGGKLPPESAIAIVAHVLDALGYAHERGIIHRDIKPANIMIKSDGRVKVADFGLVKRLSDSGEGSPDSAALTMTNVAIGTPDFVAPESLEIGRAVDHRADLYAIGVMFYQMLTGVVPRGNFKPPSGKIPELDARLDVIVMRAMEADPEDRYASAEEFRSAIDEILSSPVPEEQPTAPVSPGQEENTSPVTPGGKRLHITSVQKKTAPPKGSTGPVKGPASSRARGGRSEGARKKNPALLAALIGVPVLVLGIAGFLFFGGGDQSGGKNRPTEIAKDGKARENPTKKPTGSKPRPTPSNRTPKEEVKSPVRPSPKPTKPAVAVTTRPKADPKPPAPKPKPEPAGAPISAAPIDLLASIDLGRDVVKGEWQLDGGKLTRQSASMSPSVIRVAKGPFPVEYDLEFQLERLGNEGWGCNLGFVMSGYQGSLVIAGEPVTGGWWFEAIDGRGWKEAVVNEPGNYLAIGEVHAVRLEVRKDRIAAFLDGEELLSWEGEPDRLSLYGEWPRLMPDADHLYFGAKGPFAIHKLALIPKSAGDAAMPAVTEALADTPDPDDPVAARLAEIDGKYRELFEKPYTDALASLNIQFTGALQREEKAASQTGDLDLVLAFQNEVKQIGNGQGAGPADAADVPPKLKQWRTTWHTQHRKLLDEQAVNRKNAHAARDQALDRYQQDLVKAQDIAAAQRVKDLREQFAANPGNINTANMLVPAARPGRFVVGRISDPENLPDPDGREADMSQPVQVFILLGDQSMFGAGRVNGTGPGSLNVAVKRGAYPYLVDSDGNWTTRKDVRNVFVSKILGEQKNDWLTASGTERIGPEIGFGSLIGEAIDAPVLIIKSCNGNRSLGWDLLPPGSERYEHQGKIYAGYKESPSSWNKGSKPKPIDWYAGKQHDDDVASAKMVLENLGKYYPGAREYEIAGFVFWQGDKDRNDAGHVERYELNLVNLIKSLRKDFEAPDAKFVCATMGHVRKDAGGAEGKIRTAQLAVDGETGKYEAFKGNVATVFTHPLSRGGTPRDGYKGIAETYMDVGLALGSAMAELLKNPTP